MPLNAAYADEIVQENNSTYQLSFRFPTSDSLWEQLKEEAFLTADDLHGEQDFVIFEVEKKHGYIQVYANQVFTLLNNYVVSSLTLDRATGSTALSRFAGAITRDNPFSFFSDIEDRHTFNIGSKNAMEAFAKDKHSIIGQWGGDLVRHGYQVRLLKNGGSENESLFMYKKNLSSYQHKTSTKSLKTRITFIATVKGEGEKAPDRKLSVVVDSPLINKYSQIYEDVIEVNDRDVKDEASLRKYGEQYYRTSLCDMMEDSLELEVVGQSDVPVQMFDIVSLFHDVYNLDVRKKITKYTYSPMGKKLKTIGFGQFKSGLANAIGNAVSDAVKGEAQQLQSDFERQLARELKNADLAFDRQKEELVNQFTDGLNAAKARAEEVKRELSDTINQRFDSFDNASIQEAKRRAEEALRNAGASSLLAQEAKRIGLDSVAKLEEFKRQATSAQTALSGDLDVLKRIIANDVRPKQAQAEAEIAKQVEALIQTKKELAGVKSAQATYEETTTRRLSELTNLANGKASKSELTQTAEQLASKIASVRVGGRNYIRGTRRMALANGLWTSGTFRPSGVGATKTINVSDSPATGFDKAIRLTSSNARDQIGIAQDRFEIMPGTYTISVWVKGSVGQRVKLQTYWAPDDATGISPDFILKDDKWTYLTFSSERKKAGIVSIGYVYLVNADAGKYLDVLAPQLENGSLATSPKEAPEDTDGQISAVESTFKQRADSLDAGVRRLTEGLRTKADISTLNVTAENIRQSVKSLETDTQNKLNQKLSLAEFEVRAGSIRQEILNSTKDKADKTLVVAEAGKLREEFSNLRVGGRNYYRDSEKIRTSTRFFPFPLHPYLSQKNVGETWTLSFDIKINEGGEIRPLLFYHYQNNRFGLKASANITPSKEWQRFTFTGPVIFPNDDSRYSRGEMALYDYAGNNNYSVRRIKLEKGTLATDWSPAIEDTDGLITEAKATFERTAQGLRTDLSAIQEYVNKDGQRQEALQRYTREESAKQATAVRELVAKDYVGKATYQETVRAIENKFEAITNPQNGSITTRIANYKKSVDGRFADITSLIAGKANQTDFQHVKETSQLYERIIGSNENDISNKVARMALTNQLFQVEVSKNENLKTVQSQLAGSWGVHNKNSVNEIIAGFNLAGRNAGIKAETIRLEGNTLADKLTAIDGYFKRLFVGEGTFATLNADVIRTNSITADKLVFNEALANRMVSNEHITNKLVASRAFVNALKAVTIDASQIVTGTLKGDRIYGGTIRGTEINGTTITGNSRMTIGDNGFLRPTQEGGLQINVPETYSASKGVGVQLLGRELGRIPKGMFIYNSPNWNGGNIIGDNTEDILLTVKGRVSLCNLHNGSPVSGVPIISNFEYQNPIRNLYPIRFIGWDPRSNQLYVDDGTGKSGTWWISVDGSTSDKNLKTNIGDTHYNALDFVQKLMFKEFDWKTDKFGYKKPYTNVGLIAQDVEKIDSSLVYKKGETLALDDFRLLNIALKAIQELALENRKLTHRLENLENERRTA
nr:MAG TPA: Neck appendage protein [Caudoviricetes sp.]